MNHSTANLPPPEKGAENLSDDHDTFSLDDFRLKNALATTRVNYFQYPYYLLDERIWVSPLLPSFMHSIIPQ